MGILTLVFKPAWILSGIFGLVVGCPFSTAAAQEAKIAEILGDPVSVRPAQQPDREKKATVGMELADGDQIRTRGVARAQVQTADGLFYRIGGNAVLTIRPDYQLQFKAGRMITWVDRPLARPVRIQTPMAVAAIQGTTVFVDMPEHQKWARFFSWEGTVTVSLPDGTQSVTLQGGQAVMVPAGATHLPPVYTLDPDRLSQQFKSSTLLNGFESTMSTFSKIEAVVRPK